MEYGKIIITEYERRIYKLGERTKWMNETNFLNPELKKNFN